MKTFNKYSLYLLSAYACIVAVWGAMNWATLVLTQKCVLAALIIVTLHEWEEQRFPGGFLQMMAKIMKLDVSNVDFHDMYAKPDILIFVITGLALLFKDIHFFACAVIFLGLYEGVVHIMGIKLGKPEKPYTPGMVTGEIYAVISIISIVLLNKYESISIFSWVIGILWFFVCFIIMELSIWKAAGLGPKDVKEKMLSNFKNGNQ